DKKNKKLSNSIYFFTPTSRNRTLSYPLWMQFSTFVRQNPDKYPLITESVPDLFRCPGITRNRHDNAY
ncbi:hypothetical protein, partial [Alistipes putredinis]|uniref:hypothetical protein n=1 Tax=Alistipes putredinis TaxID=28117 RepID=UPI003A932942